MSLAPVAYLLFQKVMRHNPSDTHWPGRDRFVLSCGHTSLTLYIQLYLGGFGSNSRTSSPTDFGDRRLQGTRSMRTPRSRGHYWAARPRRCQRCRWRCRLAGCADCSIQMPRRAPVFDHHIYRLASMATSRRASLEASSLAATQRLDTHPDL